MYQKWRTLRECLIMPKWVHRVIINAITNSWWNSVIGPQAFNRPLNNWDTSSATNFNNMFHTAESFDKPIFQKTAKATTMYAMFHSTKFNQALTWDTRQVVNMAKMFQDTSVSMLTPMRVHVTFFEISSSLPSCRHSINQSTAGMLKKSRIWIKCLMTPRHSTAPCLATWKMLKLRDGCLLEPSNSIKIFQAGRSTNWRMCTKCLKAQHHSSNLYLRWVKTLYIVVCSTSWKSLVNTFMLITVGKSFARRA